MGRGVGIAAVVGALGLMLGCGSGGTGQVRFVQASPGQPLLNLLVDGKEQAANLAYGNATGYLSVQDGTRQLQAVSAISNSTVFTAAVPIANGGDTTVVMTGPSSAVKTLVLTDGGTASVAGDGYVRIINASVSIGSADIYLLAAGTNLTGATPIATNAGLGANTGYQAVTAGDYEVFMTKPGTQNVLLDTGPVSITAGQNTSLLVLDGTSGGFTFTTLIDQ